MSRWLLALLLTAAGAPLAAARDAVSAIDACIGQLDAGLDVGYARIAERCPDLAPSLEASAAAAWLPADWNKPGNELSAAGLAELRTLLTRQPSPAGARALRVARLRTLLEGLAANDRRGGGWWARFKEWLREVLARRPPGQEDPGWLRRLIGDLGVSQAVLEASVWGALAVVIALATTIVVNELRIAGLFSGWRRRTAAGASRSTAARAPLTLEEVERASPAEQPRLLLALIVARLREQERLPPERGLTVHELRRAANLPEQADRERLAALTAACERVRFGAPELSLPALGAALARGRELLAALEVPALPAEGAG
jgi:hypothetical protein